MPDSDLRAELETLRAEVAELRHWQAAHVCAAPVSLPYMQAFGSAGCAGGYTYTVPVGESLTVNCYVDTAGAAPVAGSYVVNYAS